ncbi:hypothetical protein LCGC14_1079200 [marine sediment metagenome]|uniref:Uncharacterized protein n=1 Tax=marine sediment metagenome TaxID=412755 RepID=A0A0F9MKK9_9ZZZZ
MNVIHDNELGGIMMIPLIVDWRVSTTCQIDGCTEKTNTIICFNDSETPTGNPLNIGICENHYVEAKKSGRFDYKVNV